MRIEKPRSAVQRTFLSEPRMAQDLSCGKSSRDINSGRNISNDATFLDSELVAGTGGNVGGREADQPSLSSAVVSTRPNTSAPRI